MEPWIFMIVYCYSKMLGAGNLFIWPFELI